MKSCAPPSAIDSDEQTFYDRQIRIWGPEAQGKIKESSVQIVVEDAAYICTVGQELVKNLVLVGFGTVILVGTHTATRKQAQSSFFLTDAHIGQNALQLLAEQAQRLNGNVSVLYAASATKTDFSVFLGSAAPICSFSGVCFKITLEGERASMATTDGSSCAGNCCCKEGPAGLSAAASLYTSALSAIIGGIAVQQLVFLATDQRKPEKMLFVYDALTGTNTAKAYGGINRQSN